MVDLTDSELYEAVLEASRGASLSATGAQIIHHYANVVFLLPAENAVARMATGSRSAALIETSQRVTRWLVDEHGFGATEPLRNSVPVLVRPKNGGTSLTVSFWRYYQQPEPSPVFDSTCLGSLLRTLHALPDPPFELPAWRPLTSLRNALTEEPHYVGLSTTERAWLVDRVEAVTEQVDAFDWPLGAGLIHGDAWAGNILWDTGPSGTPASAATPILGDWDGVSVGPREVDLIPTWHAAARYGRDPSWVARFIEVYGYDLAASPGFELLMRMRDLVQLSGPLRRADKSPAHLAALRQRFEAIRKGDQTMTWTGL